MCELVLMLQCEIRGDETVIHSQKLMLFAFLFCLMCCLQKFFSKPRKKSRKTLIFDNLQSDKRNHLPTYMYLHVRTYTTKRLLSTSHSVMQKFATDIICLSRVLFIYRNPFTSTSIPITKHHSFIHFIYCWSLN